MLNLISWIVAKVVSFLLGLSFLRLTAINDLNRLNVGISMVLGVVIGIFVIKPIYSLSQKIAKKGIEQNNPKMGRIAKIASLTCLLLMFHKSFLISTAALLLFFIIPTMSYRFNSKNKSLSFTKVKVLWNQLKDSQDKWADSFKDKGEEQNTIVPVSKLKKSVNPKESSKDIFVNFLEGYFQESDLTAEQQQKRSEEMLNKFNKLDNNNKKKLSSLIENGDGQSTAFMFFYELQDLQFTDSLKRSEENYKTDQIDLCKKYNQRRLLLADL